MSGGTPLQGRQALVTGASSGLGADFARELAGRGAAWSVRLTPRRTAAALAYRTMR